MSRRVNCRLSCSTLWTANLMLLHIKASLLFTRSLFVLSCKMSPASHPLSYDPGLHNLTTISFEAYFPADWTCRYKYSPWTRSSVSTKSSSAVVREAQAETEMSPCHSVRLEEKEVLHVARSRRYVIRSYAVLAKVRRACHSCQHRRCGVDPTSAGT